MKEKLSERALQFLQNHQFVITINGVKVPINPGDEIVPLLEKFSEQENQKLKTAIKNICNSTTLNLEKRIKEADDLTKET